MCGLMVVTAEPRDRPRGSAVTTIKPRARPSTQNQTQVASTARPVTDANTTATSTPLQEHFTVAQSSNRTTAAGTLPNHANNSITAVPAQSQAITQSAAAMHHHKHRVNKHSRTCSQHSSNPSTTIAIRSSYSLCVPLPVGHISRNHHHNSHQPAFFHSTLTSQRHSCHRRPHLAHNPHRNSQDTLQL